MPRIFLGGGQIPEVEKVLGDVVIEDLKTEEDLKRFKDLLKDVIHYVKTKRMQNFFEM